MNRTSRPGRAISLSAGGSRVRVVYFAAAFAADHAAMSPSDGIQFTDVTTQAGIQFKHKAGGQARNICRRPRDPARILRLRRRRLARHSVDQQQGLDAARPHARLLRSTITTTTARSPTSPRAADWMSRCMAWVWRSATTTTTARTTSTYRARRGPSVPQRGQRQVPRRDRRRPESRTRISAPAPPGSTTTRTASSICSSPTTCNGRRRRTCGARSTARPNPTARRNLTKACPASSIAISAAENSRT